MSEFCPNPSKSFHPCGLGFLFQQTGIHAINSFFSIYSVIGTLPDTGNMAADQTNKVPSLMALIASVPHLHGYGGDRSNKQ